MRVAQVCNDIATALKVNKLKQSKTKQSKTKQNKKKIRQT